MTPVLKQFDLSGRTALITGSSAGIGLALAQGLAGAGAAVVLNARNAAKLQAAAAGAARAGRHGACAGLRCHRRRRRWPTRWRGSKPRSAPIDILVNNAGMQKRAPLQDFEQADWQQLMRTNLDSVFIVGQAVARHMIAARARQDHQHLLGAERTGPARASRPTPPARAR